MQTRTIHAFLSAATTASTSASYKCDYRFDSGTAQRNIYGSLTSGAEINIFITTTDRITAASVTHLETTISAGSTEFTTATNSFSIVLNGPIDVVTVEKVGSSGTATVVGIV